MAVKRLPTQIVFAAFQDENAAQEVADAILQAQVDSKTIICTNMATIVKKPSEDGPGKLKVKELGHPSTWESAAVGGAVGGVLGGLGLLLLGPLGVAAGASAGGTTGAALAAFGASQVKGMDKDQLKNVGEALGPGNSAIVLVFDEVLVDKSNFKEVMTEHQESYDAVCDNLADTIKENLVEGNNDVVFHLSVDEEGIMASRLILGVDAVNIQEIVLSPDGVSATEVDINEDNVTMETGAVTPEGDVMDTRAVLTSQTCSYEVDIVSEDGATGACATIEDDKVAYAVGAVTEDSIDYEVGAAMVTPDDDDDATE